jgi:hypothetical protein
MSLFWTTAAIWLVRITIGGGLLLFVATVLMRRLPRPAQRQRVGEAGLLAALLFAGLSLVPPWLQVPLSLAGPPTVPAPDRTASSGTAKVPVFDDETGNRAEGLPEVDARALLAMEAGPLPPPGHLVPAPATNETRPAEPALRPDLPAALVVGAFVLVAGLMLGRWLLGCLALGRLLRQAVPAPPAVGDLFAVMVGPGGRRPRLLVSRRVRVPLSCGLFRPTVVLPARLCEAPDLETLRWVFAHELTHLDRRDAWSCWLFGLGQAVYYFLPWFWQVRRQVRLCQELIADAAVTEHGAAAADYAEFLVTLTRRPALPVAATGVLGHSSDLLRRVTMLLQDPVRQPGRRPDRWALAACASLLALALVGSGVGVRATLAPAVTDPTQPTSDTRPIKIDTVAADQPTVSKGADRKDEKKAPDTIAADELAKAQDLLSKKLAEALKQLGKREGVAADELAKAQGLVNKELAKALKQAGKIDASKLHGETVRKLMEQIRRQVPDLPQLKNADLDSIQKEIEKAMNEIRAQQARLHDLNKRLVEEKLRAARSRLGRGSRLGVKLVTPSEVLADQLDLPKGQGLVVAEVFDGSEAARAGLKLNDVLLELNGKAVARDVDAVRKLVEEIKPSVPIEAVVLRKGKKVTIKGLTLSKTDSSNARKLKFKLHGFDGAKGLVVLPDLSALNDLADGKSVITTVVKNNDKVIAQYREGLLSINLTGTVSGGRTVVEKIEGRDGETSFTLGKGDGLGKVPEKYRDKIKKLMEVCGINTDDRKTP